MQTKYLSFCDQHLEQAGQLIREGKLVAFPTETVYGLGANALDEQAVLSTFVAKGRPSDNPLIVHVWDKSQIPQIARSISPEAQRVIDNLMPAPLTIVLPKQPTVFDTITAGLDTVAIRMPMSKQARDFLKACRVPVTAPSANTSSRPSPTNWQRVAEDMDGKIAAVLCGDACQVGIESTVLDLSTDTPRILRPGMVSPQQIAAVIGKPVEVVSNPKDKVNSPGVRYKHYAPKVPMALNLDGDRQKLADFYRQLVELGHNPVLLVADTSQFEGYSCWPIGKTNQQVARNLFENLRLLENSYSYIIASFVGSGPLADSILNRLVKSAGNNIL